MINKGKTTTTTTTEDLMIQGLLGSYLRFRSANESLSNDKHLDDDSLTAFVEGNLSERESTPILSHLVDCSFCRHVTAELVKLDFAFAGEEAPVPVIESAPSSVSAIRKAFACIRKPSMNWLSRGAQISAEYPILVSGCC